MRRSNASGHRAPALLAGCAIVLLALGGAPRPAAAQAPAMPIWPVPTLRDQVRDLLKGYYAQRADPVEDDYTFRAPRGETDKKKAWKDPDTLWEHYGGGPETRCHAAGTDMQFINCTGHRLAKTFGLSYAGNLTLFSAARGFYANDSYSQIAGYFALYHAFVAEFDAPDTGSTWTEGSARANRNYHLRMLKAYEAHMRNIIVKHFLDPAAVASPDYQASMTRSIGLTATIYMSVAQAMEQYGVWGKSSGDRLFAIALINGLNQRLFWEWMWPATDGPRTAGLQKLGSAADYQTAVAARPAIAGSNGFSWGTVYMSSLRPTPFAAPPFDGLTVDADFTVPGEWWCLSAHPPGADRVKCMTQALRESLGGANSPFGQFYGTGGCSGRPGAVTTTSCGNSNLGSVAEEWTWSLVGARKGMALIKRLAETGEPQTPAGAVGATTWEVKPGVYSSEYDMATDRAGFGISGWHGGEGYQDDLEWEWHRGSGPAISVRTLSAAAHDAETQNGRYSLGEDTSDPLSAGVDGDTWSMDRQDYPGAMENHAPGPHPMYGTLLFGLTLWDQVADGSTGLSRSFYDTATRNHPDEFLSWVKLLAATYYRCASAADPLDPACADFTGADRLALFTPPADASVDLRYRYLWRGSDTPFTPLIAESRLAAGDPEGLGIPACRSNSGLPWRGVYDFDTGGDRGYMLDEGGFGAYNSLVQGMGGFMRLVAARYPLAAPDSSLDPAYAAQRAAVLKPWYDHAFAQVDGILKLYRDDVNGYGYVPDIENSACRGEDPTAPGQYMMLAWRQGTGETVHQTTVRRAMWYSILAVWYLWYDSGWLDVDPAVWIAG